MSVMKDKERNTWRVFIRYVDWQGKKQRHTKRGFKTKREALEYERELHICIHISILISIASWQID